MSFTTRLRLENAANFDAALAHPFVTGIGDGTLPREFFARWIAQDWLYLHGYVQALFTASQLAKTEHARTFWHELAIYTRDEELDLHRQLAARFELTLEQLDATTPYPSTTNYLKTLHQACAEYPTLVATVTPCAVGYGEVGAHLASLPPSPEPDYVTWIDTYTGPDFEQTIHGFVAELEQCAATTTDPATIQKIEQAYARATLCELAFWDGLWHGC